MTIMSLISFNIKILFQKNDGIKVDVSESFYCGDAAGRAANWAPGKKKDHSMADKLMAENLGLQFYTPEQFFLGHSIKNVPFQKPEFDPREVQPHTFDEKLISTEKEVCILKLSPLTFIKKPGLILLLNFQILVLVGFPGSGKSFLAKQIEKKSNNKYIAVCRDKLGTWQKCASEAARILDVCIIVITNFNNLINIMLYLLLVIF